MRLTYSQKRRAVEEFCPIFELFCRALSIRIDRVSKSSSGETVYYTLSRDKNRYKTRISCHPATRKTFHFNTHDIDLVQGDDFATGLQKLFVSLGVTNIKKKLSGQKPFF